MPANKPQVASFLFTAKITVYFNSDFNYARYTHLCKSRAYRLRTHSCGRTRPSCRI